MLEYSMKFLSHFWNTIKPTVLRFPAAFLLSAMVAVFLSINLVYSYGSYNFYLAMCLSCAWAFGLSVFLRLLLERLISSLKQKNTIFLLVQMTCIILAYFPGYLLCKNDTPRFYIIYFGTLMALFVFCLYLLYFFQQKEKVIPNVVMSLAISLTIALCIGIGASVIALAIDRLICHIANYNIHGIIWACSFCFFFPCVFISYATKSDKDISIPKTFKVIVFHVLFSLYCILLFVLYIYLIKSLVTLTLPSGKINPFVSGATVLYLFFYLSLASYKNKVTSFFYSYGSIFLLVLIAVQIVAFAVRINAYGFTPVRFASFYYIIFSIIFCILPLIKKGKDMQLVYPIFGLMCLLASISPLNIIDSANRNQYSRIISTLKKYDLYKNKSIIPAPSEDTISPKDKNKIVSAFKEIQSSKGKKPEALEEIINENVISKAFKNTFGFEFYYDYDYENTTPPTEAKKYGYNLDVPKERPVDIRGLSEMFYFNSDDSYYKKNPQITVEFGNHQIINITDEIFALAYERDNLAKVDSNEPLVIKKDGFTLIIRQIDFRKTDYASGTTHTYYRIIGYACR